MRSIVIRNVGPIKDVSLELSKVTVIMGQQSSGKSTIAKIISQCIWLEKQYTLKVKSIYDGFEDTLIKYLIDYHRLSSDYFTPNSYIYYRGEHLELTFNGSGNGSISLFDTAIENSKIIYIPSERNFVSIVPNLGNYAEEDGGILDFIKNWFEAKRKYEKSNALQILNLGVTYYNVESNDYNKLILSDGKELHLQNASSGLQSVIPLITLFDYVARGIYNEARPISVNETDTLIKQIKLMIEKMKQSNDLTDLKNTEQLLNLLNTKTYHNSQLIIEEPEQNLYPQTQRSLIEYMLTTLNESKRDDMLLLTTHSPYILYAINNCMLGYLVKDTMPEERKARMQGQSAWINPQDVSIWEIEDGHLVKIQDEKGLLQKNHFNEIMKQVMNDFDSMLNYYENED